MDSVKGFFKLKPIVAVTLAILIAFGAMYTAPMVVTAAETGVSSTAADKTFDVSSAAELTAAASEINAAESGTFDINITGNFSVTGGVEFNKNSTTIYGGNNTISFSGLCQGLNIADSATLNLGAQDYSDTLTLSGNNVMDNDNPGLLAVIGSAAICNMYSGVTVKDHKGNDYYGGGVTVESGTFNMYGGTIDNCGIDGGSVCYGGGVAVFGKGRFVMNGGTISNCYALSDYVASSSETFDGYSGQNYKTAMGGGVFVTGQSTFIMNNGTITRNRSTRRGGGIVVTASKGEGSSYGVINSKTVINGGTISDNMSNVGGGIYVNGFEYPYAAGIAFSAIVNESVTVEQPITTASRKRVLNSTGADEEPAAGFNMNGGTVTGNTSKVAGGGIALHSVKENVTLKNVDVINNETEYTEGLTTSADDADGYRHYNENGKGGGILVGKDNKNLTIEKCTVDSNNSAKNGGGVAIVTGAANPTLIKDTDISGNTSGARGAGVYYDSQSKLRMSGADTVQGNIYDNHLNNVNVLSTSNPIYVVGDLTGSQIGLSDPSLWDDNLTDADAPDDGSAQLLTNGYMANNPDVHPDKYFTSDHSTWYVDYSAVTENTKNVTRNKYDTSITPVANSIATGNRLGYKYGYSKLPVILKAKTFTKGVAKSVDAIYSELIAIYKDNSENSNFVEGASQTTFSTSDGINVTVNKNTNDVTVVSTSSSDSTKSTTLSASVSNQSYYAADGEIYLTVTNGGTYNIINLSYGTSGSGGNTTIYTPDTSIRTFYLIYDEIGRIIGKPSSAPTRVAVNDAVQTTVSGGDEVRLVRKTYDVNYHINNEDMSDIYADEIFTPYVTNHEVKEGNVIKEFHNIPKLKDPDGYVFKGWYYDPISDEYPVKFGETYDSEDIHKGYHKNVDIYAHWEKVEKIEQEKDIDNKDLPSDMQDNSDNKYYYDSFGLFGVQLRPDNWIDENTTVKENGGLRFATSIGEKLLKNIDDLSEKKVESEQKIPGSEEHYMHDVEYGFVTASEAITNTIVNDSRFNIDKSTYKLQYKGKDVNGIDTTVNEASANNFRYVTNVDCTSQSEHEGRVYGGNDAIKIDHRDCNAYRIATFVVTYDGHPENKGKNIIARAYMRYYDANGLLRTFYNDYGGTTVYGGCCTSYNAASKLLPTEPIDYNNQITN